MRDKLDHEGLKPLAGRRSAAERRTTSAFVLPFGVLRRPRLTARGFNPSLSSFLSLLASLFLLLTFSVPAHADQPLRIAAAANLQTVLTRALIPAFEKQTHTKVIPTFGATKLLAAQIEQGAPIDLFVSADTQTVAKLARQGLLVPGTERVYAIGRLALWTRKDAAQHPKRLEDLTKPEYAKIAIANPALAPYGLAAQQAFAKRGLTAQIAPKLVQAENTAQALQYARSGNADAALTALSLVIDTRDGITFIVPDNLHAPIAQSLGIVKSSQNVTIANRFADFLTGKSAAPIWKRYGYKLPMQSLR